MRKKQKVFKGFALLCLLIGSVAFMGISLGTVFQKMPGLSKTSKLRAVPIADFTYIQSGDCADQPVEFTSTSTGEDLSYSWDFGDPNSTNNSSTNANPTHSFI